jgi:hypothetical protein
MRSSGGSSPLARFLSLARSLARARALSLSLGGMLILWSVCCGLCELFAQREQAVNGARGQNISKTHYYRMR